MARILVTTVVAVTIGMAVKKMIQNWWIQMGMLLVILILAVGEIYMEVWQYEYREDMEDGSARCQEQVGKETKQKWEQKREDEKRKTTE
eukprot:353553-Heterocapsa_arctica.AAC.1